ncbi:helix-turn-helix domain-containing protein [Providencia vermicola]|uniref:Helix-turn-helix transcriptional regulator n=3 Tax=Providencia TaxID=586 RepID=A0AAI9I4D9_PROST|nr:MULTISPECIES: helix-turn-helix transcriptional regulator [Providencia]ELR5037642.1 helix-turn-helix transcriptional regulator [Providencia stuartii]ELR5121972.1 helix-turn-helix transcriptional regulator [Providencia stuartii]ELR5123493.1 helix-turn-helix transcriptional regulator [Providencia stuartii]ELR5140762.1 helix-turn-helix transcriptional regulator [Providencia stuartii]ELX8379453.1 helix-turn-helix transcriptional regulator [Providencia stuartii]
MKKSEDININDFFSFISLAIGRTLKRIRKSQGLTAGQFGKLVNLSQQQMSRYECGSNRINVCLLLLLLDKIDITIDEFNLLLIEEINIASIEKYIDLNKVLSTSVFNKVNNDSSPTSSSPVLFG